MKLAALWRNGDIFKDKKIRDRLRRVHGTIEEEQVFANYDKMKIPVRPANPGVVRSGFSSEKVSFYLGFAIVGPLAYDIKYESWSCKMFLRSVTMGTFPNHDLQQTFLFFMRCVLDCVEMPYLKINIFFIFMEPSITWNVIIEWPVVVKAIVP